MRPFDIHALLAGLAEKRPVFHSEADFQFALAWEIKEQKGLDVRLEYPPFPSERMRLDIWVPDLRKAIELKYPTCQLDVTLGDEHFALREQGASDFGQYDFLKDIARLEHLSTDLPQIRSGIAVLLTNDPLYWDSSRRSTKADDVEFRLNAGRHLPRKMDWPDQKRKNKGKEHESPIVLSDSYTCIWRDYGQRITDPTERRGTLLRYLAIEVRR